MTMKCRNIFLKLLLIIFFILFTLSVYLIIKDYFSYKENEKLTDELIDQVVDVNPTTDDTSIDWKHLKSINSDIIAWIEIENTSINYPILKDNNLYYLKHSYDKKYNKNGSIFTTDTYPFESEETVLYGHNMKNGSMFSDLGKYLKKDFFYAHNIIKIYTPNGDYEAIIFSAYSIGFDEENNNIKSLNFKERIEYYKKSSQYAVDGIDETNKILKLSTCSYINAKTIPTDQRYYIIATILPNMYYR